MQELQWFLKMFSNMETFCRNAIPANHLYYAIYAITCLFICSFQFQQNLLTVLYFKVGLSPSKQNCFVCFKESPLKMMNNTCYFTLKVLSVLKIFKFLSWLFWSYRKSSLIRKTRLISTFWRHSLVKKQLQYTYCPISHEIKAVRQWHLVS